MKGSLDARISGEDLLLLPDRALFWPKEQTLLVADVHFGKAASFRAMSVPVPPGSTSTDTKRLSRLLEQTQAQRLIVLGDLWHDRSGLAAETVAAVARWRESWPSVPVQLVAGNHDRRTGDLPMELGVELLEPNTSLGPFLLTHEPEENPGGYVLCGHIHPCVRLGNRAGSLRLPCFWFSATLGMLPAFGSFTGCAEVRPEPEDLVVVCAEDRLFKVGQA